MKSRIDNFNGSSDILTTGSAPKRSVNLSKRLRQEWEDAFRDMAARGDDELLDSDLLDRAYDEDGW
jgi:hypothetical protein